MSLLRTGGGPRILVCRTLSVIHYFLSSQAEASFFNVCKITQTQATLDVDPAAVQEAINLTMKALFFLKRDAILQAFFK